MNVRRLYPHVVPIRETGGEYNADNPEDSPCTQRAIASLPLRLRLNRIYWIPPDGVGQSGQSRYNDHLMVQAVISDASSMGGCCEDVPERNPSTDSRPTTSSSS